MSDEMLKSKTLLVVDDEIDLRDILSSELEYLGAKVYQTGNITDAQALLNLHHIDLIITDIRMPGGTGIDLLHYVKKKWPLPVILITGFADITAEEAYQKGAEALIHKPFMLDDLIKTVQKFISPQESWFREKFQDDKLVTLDDLTLVEVGRGGMSVSLSMTGKRFEVGEILNFKVQHNGTPLEGQGKCRWIKLKSNDHRQAFAGIEFTYLSQESFKFLESILKNTKSSSFIPSVKF